MDITILKLLASMSVVFFAALIFVNAIEYLAYRLGLGHSFVGAIIAPCFTSIPELTIFLVAVFGVGQVVGEKVGIGTIFGQPFMASSLSYGLVGLAVLLGFLTARRRRSFLRVDRTLAIPYVCIIVLFPLTIVPGLLVRSDVVRFAFGLIFIGAFLFYTWMMFRKNKGALVEESEDCYVSKYAAKIIRWPLVAALIQVGIACVGLFVGSTAMVEFVITIAGSLKMDPLGLALIVVPAASAMPETMSALIWGYRGRDTLSLGSLVGEKILYSTVYPGVGLFLTSWVLDRHAYFSVLATTVISFILLIFILRRKMPWWSLCLGLFFFIAYGILIFTFHF
jgi:cation:H+ antiporter